MLQHVGWCWVSSENGQIFVTFLDVARVWPANLYSISQHNLTMLADIALKCCVCFTGPQDLLDLEKHVLDP